MLNLATEASNAIAEVVEPGTIISTEFLRDRILSQLDLSELRFADLGSRASLGYGLSLEVVTSTDYTRGQEWASALAEVGFDGISYPSSRVPHSTLIAVFGQEGAGERLKVIRHADVSLDELKSIGVTVLAIPSSSELDLY